MKPRTATSIGAHRLDGRMTKRLAVVAYHSSPLAEPGAGDAGGMTVYVRSLAAELAARGVSTDIFTRAATAHTSPQRILPGVRVIPLPAGEPGPMDKNRMAGFIGEFADGVRGFAAGQRIRYDLVHSHYWQSGLAGGLLTRWWGVPLVHSPHTLALVKDRFRAPGELPEPETRRTGEKEALSAADVLIASTTQEFHDLACLYGTAHDKIKTIHPGVDHDLFRPGDRLQTRRDLGFTHDAAMLLFVGRIQPLKGIDLAIRALPEVARALRRAVRLVVVGGPSGDAGARELQRLQRLATDLGVTDSVLLSGPQPHRRLPAFYAASDVTVVTSYSESFGLAALEAHACGIPVVGTAVGGLSHIVHDGLSGQLVQARDPFAFADAIVHLVGDSSTHRAASRAALRSAQDFSWGRTADALLDLYDCLMREKVPEACVC